MICPKCKSEMKIVKHEYIQVDKCTSCNGIWFDLMEREDLLKINNADKIDNITTIKTDAISNSKEPILCPKCNVKMHILRDVLQNQIEYEQCGSCKGVFLDAGEFTDLKNMSFKEFYRSLKVL